MKVFKVPHTLFQLVRLEVPFKALPTDVPLCFGINLISVSLLSVWHVDIL